MNNRLEEIKESLELLNATIRAEEKRRDGLLWQLTAFDRVYLVTLYERRSQLEAELLRAETDAAYAQRQTRRRTNNAKQN